MVLLSVLNNVLAFGLELMALLIVGYMGTKISSSLPLKVLGSLVVVGVLVVVWGTYLAPKAATRLPMPYLLLAKLVILLLPNFAFLMQGQTTWAVVWSTLVVGHLGLAWWMNEV